MTTIEYNPPETYADNSRELIAQARAELAAGDLLQASEKAWGAAAAAVKSVADKARLAALRPHSDCRCGLAYLPRTPAAPN